MRSLVGLAQRAFVIYIPISLCLGCVAANGSSPVNDDAVQCKLDSPQVIKSNEIEPIILRIENSSEQRSEVAITYVLSLNSSLAETPPVHPVFGLDHAVNAKSDVEIDGKPFGNALVTDGSDFTSFESPWGSGYKEAVVTIELDQARRVEALHWLAADANWIWHVDVASSLDGQAYQAVDSLQSFDMYHKWGNQEFPLREPIELRFLKMRFFNQSGAMNVIRLPKSIQIYDGIGNDTVRPPAVGKRVDGGELKIQVDPNQTQSIPIVLKKPLSAGSYLLSWEVRVEERSTHHWTSILVQPTDIPDKNLTRRFGINASNIELADSLSSCGFGWVRFENGKWNMSSNAKDHYDFSGGVAPWHVNQDSIYGAYRERDMKVLPYVFQTPEWATTAGAEISKNRAGYPPQQAQDYGDAIYQFVARFGKLKQPSTTLLTRDKISGLDRIDAIELWNEPNLVGPDWAPFVGSISRYFEVMRAGVEGARRADPKMVVTSCGWAGVEPETIQQMTEYKYSDGKCPLDLVDVINVHFYSGVQEPEISFEDPNTRKEKSGKSNVTYLEQLDELIRWRNTNKPTAEIWMTETGNDVGGPIGLSERKQAAKLPRVVMITLARGIDKVFIYRESGSQPSMHAGAGLIRDDGSLRPSWLTMATVIRQLAGFEGGAERIVQQDSNVWVLRWTQDGRSVVAAWTIGEEIELEIAKVTEGKSPNSAVDAFGHSIELDESKTAKLTEFPIYIAF